MHFSYGTVVIIGFFSFLRTAHASLHSDSFSEPSNVSWPLLQTTKKEALNRKPQESVRWTFNDCKISLCCGQGKARRRAHGDLERSDHSSHEGLLVCWLCTSMAFLIKEPDSTAGQCMPESQQAIGAHFVVEYNLSQSWVYQYLRGECKHTFFVVFRSYLPFKVS